MKTVAESLKEFSGKIKDLLTDLIQNHSEIYRWNTPSYDDSAVFVVGDYAWRDLKPEGNQIQSKLLNEYRHFYAILKTLLQGQPEDQLNELDEHHKTFLTIIEQTDLLYKLDKKDQLNEAISALNNLLSLLDNVHDIANRNDTLISYISGSIENPIIRDRAVKVLEGGSEAFRRRQQKYRLNYNY
jgi:mRNA-degrading endonuclease RelE of RelBE toxin-antitoxin system